MQNHTNASYRCFSGRGTLDCIRCSLFLPCYKCFPCLSTTQVLKTRPLLLHSYKASGFSISWHILGETLVLQHAFSFCMLGILFVMICYYLTFNELPSEFQGGGFIFHPHQQYCWAPARISYCQVVFLHFSPSSRYLVVSDCGFNLHFSLE